MLLALSDLIIAGTLFANAGACLNFKLPLPEVAFGEPEGGAKERAFALVASLRILRVPLALWNCLVLVLMLLWFP